MRAILSLCNEKRSPSKGVLLYDFALRTGTWLPVGADAEIMGTRGVCRDGNDLYVLYTVGWYDTRIARYDVATDEPVLAAEAHLPSVQDPHSICMHEGRLLIASTGTDEILAYRLESGIPVEPATMFWRASNSRSDTHHVNSVASDGERVLISAFGPKGGQFWSSAQNGYIVDVTQNNVLLDGLRHPHSLRAYGGAVYFTESSRQVLHRIGNAPIIIGGYARGCDLAADSKIIVGSNVARRVSRSQGVVTNSANAENTQGETVGKCSLVCVTLNGAVHREFFDLSAYGKEIYDICVLP